MDNVELKERRKKLGLTQLELAERLGYTSNYIYMLEAGRAPISSPQRLHLLLTAIESEKKQQPRKKKT